MNVETGFFGGNYEQHCEASMEPRPHERGND